MKLRNRGNIESAFLEPLESRVMMAADLVPGGITLQYPGVLGGNAELRPIVFSVANLGNRRAPIGTIVRFYLSRDTILDSDDLAIRNSVIPVPVRPGENVAFSKVLRMPRAVDGGDYHILMQVDPDNRCAEADETNNTLPSAMTSVLFAPRIGSLEISKRYLRPGSVATVVARNVTDMDPGTGQVRFYYVTGNPNSTYPRVLLGTGTRSGRDYSLDFVPDASWLTNSNRIIAVASKAGGISSEAMAAIEGRNVGPTIDSFHFSPAPLARGRMTTFEAIGLSGDAASISIHFDSNFDGVFQFPPVLPSTQPYDAPLASSAVSGSALSLSFTVPEWFPAAPTRVFIVVRSQLFQFQSAQRVYSTLLSAH